MLAHTGKYYRIETICYFFVEQHGRRSRYISTDLGLR